MSHIIDCKWHITQANTLRVVAFNAAKPSKINNIHHVLSHTWLPCMWVVSASRAMFSISSGGIRTDILFSGAKGEESMANTTCCRSSAHASTFCVYHVLANISLEKAPAAQWLALLRTQQPLRRWYPSPPASMCTFCHNRPAQMRGFNRPIGSLCLESICRKGDCVYYSELRVVCAFPPSSE